MVSLVHKLSFILNRLDVTDFMGIGINLLILIIIGLLFDGCYILLTAGFIFDDGVRLDDMKLLR
jgi:uncharacterized membrane protein